MLQYLSTYCDINEIFPQKDYEAIGTIIESQQYSHVVTMHTFGFVLYYFDQLVKGQITPEDYMTMGDIGLPDENGITNIEASATLNPYTYTYNHKPTLASVSQLFLAITEGKKEEKDQYRDSLIVVELVSYQDFLRNHEEKALTDALTALGSRIIPLG